MNETLGAAPPADTSHTQTISLRLYDGPLEFNWDHCGITADFLGDFNGVLAAQSKLDAVDAQASISYMTNELLENAFKFMAGGDITLVTSFDAPSLTLRLGNETAPERAERFSALLHDITARDPGELMLERIEANALDPEATGSGLGTLSLMNDYGAIFGWTFEQPTPDATVHVETRATLTLA